MLDETEENHETLNQYSRCTGRDSNRIPPKYKSETLLYEPARW
jgi:hypothetical protein